MLNIMREKAGSWIIKIILGVIVVVFVFWGVGSYRENQANRVALVNGETIDVETHRRAYHNYLQRLEQQYGQALSQDMIKFLQVPRKVLDGLISQRLMLQEANKLDLRVTNEELVESIQNVAAFQEAGIFSNRRYQMILDHERIEPEAFEVSQREMLLLNKVQTLVTNNVKVTEGEIKEWYEWQNATVNLNYVLFSPDGYKDIEPSDSELTDFYNDTKENYKSEPVVKVRYLEFDPEQFVSTVEIDDKEIAAYYENHQSDYHQPKTVGARHILIKVDQNASEEVVAEKKKKAEEILGMATGGEDFAELAKKYSEGPSKDRGGDLGEFKKETMVAPFAEKAFSMAPGEISEPVRTQFGWHIIKVEKVNEEATQPLTAVSDDIRKKLARVEAKEVAYDTADTVYGSLYSEEDLEKVAGANDLSVKTTEFFTRKGPETGVGDARAFAEIAFDLEDMEISDIQTIGDRYFILQKVAAKPAIIQELETVREKVRNACIEKMQDDKAKEDAESLLKAAREGTDLKAAAEKIGREVTSTGFFKREGEIPTMGREFEIAQAAFLLSKENDMPDHVLKGAKGYYIIKLVERKSADKDDFDDQKESIQKRVLDQKKDRVMQAWLDGVREKSEIIVEEGYQYD